MRHPASIYWRSSAKVSNNFAKRLGRRLARSVNPGRANEKTNTKKLASKPRPILELSDFIEALDALGINDGDRIIIHSGLSNIGKLKGGVKPLYAHLRDRIGNNGTMLLPAFPFSTLMQNYLETNPTFDTKKSKSKMGALTQIALDDSDRSRSLHPTHSVAGIGRDLDHFLEEHHLDTTPFGPSSPFSRLSTAQGKILTLGVGLPSVTSFHVSEDKLGDQFPVKVYVDKQYRINCSDDSGRNLNVTTRCHDPFISRIRDCDLMQKPLIENAIMKTMPLGNHALSVIDCSGFDQLLMAYATKKRKTIYGSIW